MEQGADRQLAADDGRALPQFLRPLSRSLTRMITKSRPVPAGIGSALAIGFLTGGILMGAFTGGHGPIVLSGAAKVVGLKATDISISGQLETAEQDVFDALALSETRSLVGFDAEAARKRILDLPWVQHVTIRKLYPGKLQVELREKAAFAVWQRDEALFVVEESGELISKFGITDLINNRFSHLPHLVGNGAAEHAAEILPLASRYPKIAFQAQAYVRVADRRWDINFANGVSAKLPEYELGVGIARLAQLENENEILGRQIKSVDLRDAERITIRLDEDAAKERAKTVAARLKAMKKAERNL